MRTGSTEKERVMKKVETDAQYSARKVRELFEASLRHASVGAKQAQKQAADELLRVAEVRRWLAAK